jgi:hypothetical protein
MPEKPKQPTPEQRDEPLKIDLDPEATLRGLLKVEPEPREKDEEPPQGDPLMP